MNNDNLIDALNYIDDDIIENTDASRKVNKKYRIMRIARACVAACLVIAITLTTILLYPKFKENNISVPDTPTPDASVSKPDTSDLPLLEISENFGAMGFEAYMAHDISELKNANPWNSGCDIEKLPVYRNTLDLNEHFEITNIDKEKMKSLILDVANRFGLNEDEVEITTDSRAYTNSLFVKTDSFEIRVDPELTAIIEFKPALKLPQGYNFTYYANFDDAFVAAEYLKNKYNNIINFKLPKINITGGDYNFNNQQHYVVEFFDDNGDITQNIINYNFDSVTFYSLSEKESTLSMIRIFKTDLSDKIGDYPIITSDEAEKLLKKGNFITNVPSNYEMKVENVRKVELVYRNTYWLDKIYMPYYKFYIELPELENRHGHGLKHYGAYYVPAVDGKYISNMPV